MQNPIVMNLNSELSRRPPCHDTDWAFFNALCELGPRSRAELATTLGISKPTASESAARLTDAGLITPESDASSLPTRGRPPVLYSTADAAGHSATLSITADGVALSAHNLSGRPIFTLGRSLDSLPDSAGASRVEAVVSHILERYRETVDSPLLAVTVSQPNPVDTVGKVHTFNGSPFPQGDIDAHEFFNGALRLQVDNDAHWEATAELCERDHGLQNFLLVHIGSGIGGAIVLDGKIRRGARGFAGEFGFARVGTEKTLTQLIKEQDPSGPGGLIDRRWLRKELQRDDDRYGFIHHLGVLLSNFIIALDPEEIILSGPCASEETVRSLKKCVANSPLSPDLNVRLSTLGHASAHRGAEKAALYEARTESWSRYMDAQ